MQSQNHKYYLGAPVWTCEKWKGKLFPASTKRADWLKSYTQLFNTVEGNTTFYAMPSTQTVQKWAEQASEGFRFSLKFPGVISHECRLAGARVETELFCESLEILHDVGKLGPTFLQLPPDFDHQEYPRLVEYLNGLPSKFPFAIEVRHRDFFETDWGQQLNELLGQLNMDRVIFDSRALFHFPPADVGESEARRRKPRLPVKKLAVGKYPFLRFIGVNDVSKLGPWIDEWTTEIANWISQGKVPYVFCHTPDDTFAPDFAKLFHESLQQKVAGLNDLPSWTGKTETQLGLF